MQTGRKRKINGAAYWPNQLIKALGYIWKTLSVHDDNRLSELFDDSIIGPVIDDNNISTDMNGNNISTDIVDHNISTVIDDNNINISTAIFVQLSMAILIVHLLMPSAYFGTHKIYK